MYKIMILLNTFSSEISWPIFTKFHIDPTVERRSKVFSNGHAPLTVMPIYGKIMIINKKTHSSSSKPRPAQMIILSSVAVTGLERCCLISAYLQWLFHSGERICISAVAISLR